MFTNTYGRNQFTTECELFFLGLFPAHFSLSKFWFTLFMQVRDMSRSQALAGESEFIPCDPLAASVLINPKVVRFLFVSLFEFSFCSFFIFIFSFSTHTHTHTHTLSLSLSLAFHLLTLSCFCNFPPTGRWYKGEFRKAQYDGYGVYNRGNVCFEGAFG